MTPSARLAAAIELLDAIENARMRKAAPADVIIERYFRKRRYAGSKDRQAIRERVFRVLRRRGELAERLRRAGTETPPMRLLALLDLRLDPGEEGPDLFSGAHAIAPADAEETRLLDAAMAVADLSEAARANLPDFLHEKLKDRFGDELESELQALSERAPLDLRINPLVCDRARLIAALAAEGIAAEPTAMSPLGVRVATGTRVDGLALYHAGGFEVQDEASQLAVLLAGPAPRMQVAELGAGGGGKTLALGALMRNSGQIFAFDIDRKRLDELKARSDRAGLRNIQCHRLTTGAEKRAIQLARFAGQMDLVLIDAPCSGSGTLRRAPDLAWRHDAEDIRQFATVQRGLLREAMALARPGGRIVYMTCSLLRDENEAVIETVLRTSPGWAVSEYRAHLEDSGIGPLPPSAAEDPRMWLTTPRRHGMDGFFVCLLAHRTES
ncbi:MAG: RsmB/NOP family class I SAM-dependent RNA methyltransferase [Rhodothalassiaceae bacterium]